MRNIDLVTVNDKAHRISNDAYAAFWKSKDHNDEVDFDEFHVQRVVSELQGIAAIMGFTLVKLGEPK